MNAVTEVAAHLYDMVDRYIEARWMVLASFPEYRNTPFGVALGADLDQLEALVRDAAAEARATRRPGEQRRP